LKGTSTVLRGEGSREAPDLLDSERKTDFGVVVKTAIKAK